DAVEDVRVDALQGVVSAALEQLGDVGPGGERAASTAQDHEPRLGLEPLAHRVELIYGLLVDRVANLGPVECDVHAVGALFNSEGCVGHAPPSDSRARSTD